MPILIIFADCWGIFGGYIVGSSKFGIPFGLYFRMTFDALSLKDIISGMVKSLCFGSIIIFVSCFEGFRPFSSIDVSKSVTHSIVRSFILIIIFDCIFNSFILFYLGMIKIDNVYRSFNDKEVLRGVNLNVNKGETFLLIGRSGAGKTVLLKNMIGLLRPDSGNIIIDGTDIAQLNKKELEKVRKSPKREKREKLEWYKKRFGVNLNSKEILPLNGSKDGITHFSSSFIGLKGDTALIPNPGYPAYAGVCLVANARLIYYDLSSKMI